MRGEASRVGTSALVVSPTAMLVVVELVLCLVGVPVSRKAGGSCFITFAQLLATVILLPWNHKEINPAEDLGIFNGSCGKDTAPLFQRG